MRIILGLVMALLGGSSHVLAATKSDTFAALNQFGEVLDFVLDEYYAEPDSQAMLDAAYKAMVEAYLPGDALLMEKSIGAGGDLTGTLAEFGEGFEAVRARVGAGVSDAALIGAALKGMLNSLDPRNEYYDAARFQEIRESWAGDFVGIGAR